MHFTSAATLVVAGVAAARTVPPRDPLITPAPEVAKRDWRDDVDSAKSLASSWDDTGDSIAESWDSYASSIANSADDYASTKVDDILSSVSDVIKSAESVASTATGSARDEATSVVESAKSVASEYQAQQTDDGNDDNDDDNGDDDDDTQQGAAQISNDPSSALVSMCVAFAAVLFGATML